MDGRKGLARRNKRERRKKQKQQRWIHAQVLGRLPTLLIEWGEGVHRDIIRHAKGLRRWYNGLGLVRCGEDRQLEAVRSLMAWRQGDDSVEAIPLLESLRGQLHSSLAEECLRRGIHYGVISTINTADRAIELRVRSFTWKSDLNGRRVFFPRFNPEPRVAYTEHFVERWMERVSGWDEHERRYMGSWDLLGALHGPNRAYVVEDLVGQEGTFRVVARVLGTSLPVGYAVVRGYQPTGGDRYTLMVTLLTEAMVEAPWTVGNPMWERLCHLFPLPEARQTASATVPAA